MSDSHWQKDWQQLEIAGDGRSLIEASAGTGKTWTIAVLYLRLLLECGLGPRQIVVTTFTEAAASELRERLRARLLEAEHEAQNFAGSLAADASPDLLWLQCRWLGNEAQHKNDLARLQLALAELDLAPVTTLHSLCARILAEHPFAAGSGFAAGELVDGRAWHEEIANDLRRMLQQSTPEALAAFLPEELRVWLDDVPDAKHIGQCLAIGSEVPQWPEPQWPDQALAEDLRQAVAGLRSNASRVRESWLALADFIASGGLVVPEKSLQKHFLENDPGKSVTKAGANLEAMMRVLPQMEGLRTFFTACRDARRQALWQHLRAWAQAAQGRRRARTDERSFDDLLAEVSAALAAEAAGAGRARPLADALFAAWPVALVDEFQDTDAVQYGILDAIYRDAEGTPRGRLVMIGDPKQAIYRFRGGDIHSYLRAAGSVPEEARLRLGTNHRSSRAMVAAINEFFACAGEALDPGEGGGGEIRYVQVAASSRRDASPYTIAGKEQTRALRIVMAEEDPQSSEARIAAALDAAANDIAAMLASGEHRIGERPLAPHDIAVLLPARAHILQMQKRLQQRGIPCVSTLKSSVFGSEMAQALQLLLHAVLHAEDEAAIRAVLASRLFGMSLGQIEAMDERDWQEAGQRFGHWRRLWQRRGVLALLDAVLEAAGPQLLDGEEGERLLTDWRHLGEILQAEAESGLGPHALLQWMAALRQAQDGGDDAAEARQLRIESEAPRLQLMTLHASKGLEFAVVFLPLMWAHGEHPEDTLVVLNDLASGKRQLRADDAARELAARELQEERFRVLYVALTRAIHACHLHVLPPLRARNAIAKEPASGTARTALDVLLARLQPALGSPELAAATPHVDWAHGWQSGIAAVLPAAMPDAAFTPQLRQLPALPARVLPARHSFTTLSRGLAAVDGSLEAAAADESEAQMPMAEALPAQDAAEAEIAALAKVRGAAFGNAMHEIFERREVGRALDAQTALVRRALQNWGLWQERTQGMALAQALARRIEATLATPLAADMPALGALPAQDMRAEMEFHFALDEASLEALHHACARHGEPGLLPQSQRTLRGLLSGKIDLVFRHQGRFHLLDYKSNFLGHAVEDYKGEALARAMDAGHYRLQALLYTLALERHLRQRLPDYQRERHLGDGWYLFARAVGLGAGAGIWRHRFSDALLDAAQAALPGPAENTETGARA